MAENQNAELPAENTPTQTLFRFVSLRSPQLSDEKDQDKRFVFIPQEMKNDDKFYIPVTTGTGSKRELLQSCAIAYAPHTECIAKDKANNLDSFKRTYKVIYDFATWLAQNKSTCTYNEFVAQRDAVFASHNIAYPSNATLWNNLIYQVVAQKEFYIKETMMQMILAIHALQNSANNESEVKLLLGARIVLPKELMMDEEDTATFSQTFKTGETKPKETFPTQDMEQQQLVSAAKMKLSRIEALTKNLTGMEKQYRKEYQAEYQIQDEAYQREIAPIMEQYGKDLEAARLEYCGVRPPGTEYNPEDPCQQPPAVPFPSLPKFDFKFRDEVSAESLVQSLKPENLEALLDVLGYKFQQESSLQRTAEEDINDLNSLLEGRNTFAEISAVINENIEKLNATIVENTQGNDEVYTSIGGVIMPLARTVTIPFTYQICPKAIYKFFNLNLALNVPDSSWDVSGVSYALISNNGAVNNSLYFVKSRTGNTIFLNDLFDQGLEFSLIQDSTFDIKVYFTNGRYAQFSTPGINVRTCVSSSFELQVEEGEPPVIIEDENHFIPSGFGFKQIGIADYLKVEQSTHAYVEGEVAHIENVMAREYREKSTRRLRRSENTTTTSSDTEREQLTDTTTANRFEMQTEIAKIMQEATDAGLSTHFNASWSPGVASFNTGIAGTYANHQSKEESTRQAVTQAQDITARAMDRIVTKVHEERIEKIIEEFEENNSHGFDNRKGDKHVVGVYRWVDKLMKNQIYNYGKRMMFEFMIPEPAKLHLLGMILNKNASELIKPEDPRAKGDMQISNYNDLLNEIKLKYWISKYNVEVDNFPSETIKVSKGIAYGRDKVADIGTSSHTTSAIGIQEIVKIPEGYVSMYYNISGGGKQYLDNGNSLLNINIGDKHIIQNHTSSTFVKYGNLEPYSGDLSISIATDRFYSFETSLSIDCQLTLEAKKQWLQKTFNAIIDAYEEALIEYNNAAAEENNKAVVIKDSNPNFYRQIENTVLRKNCISYMADRATDSAHGYGLSGLTQGSTFTDYETTLNSKLDKYTAFVKFMEQAFEWDNLSYYLYPFYWGNKQNWLDMYQAENTDPLFRAFLQSGMARVIVTVRPGFEDAVQFYLATGKIWNGGEVPVIGDELYLSIVDEMKEPKGIKQGKAWLTRLPTALNILQAESIGLKVAHALPFTTENPDDFEVPSEVITEDKFNFEKNDHLLGVQPDGSSDQVISGDWV